jgi:zinc protease
VYFVRDKPGTPTQFQMIVLAGCSDEANGQCRGVAHYLEHLVLVGRNPEHSDIAVRMFPDAYSNGWTNARSTAYVHTLPPREGGRKADVEQLFNFYAARLKDFSITDADAKRERNVVLQEHDVRVASSPFNRFARRLDRELLPDHPSGQWTIGTRETIESFTLEDARVFHRSWYGINNVFFAIKGDLDPDDVKAMAERALAGLETKRLPPRSVLRQPTFETGRTDIRQTDRHVKRASVTYKKLVRMEVNDPGAQRAARLLLSGFLTSRLPDSPYQVLVEKSELAAGAPHISLNRAASKTYALTISADVAPDVGPDALLAAIGAYADRIDKVGPPAEVIERLKRRIADSFATDDQDPARVYNRLVGWLADRNPYQDLAAWPGQVARVTASEVHAVAAALAGPGKVVTGVIVPAVQEAAQ